MCYVVWLVDKKEQWNHSYSGDSAGQALRVYNELVMLHGRENVHLAKVVEVEIELTTSFFKADTTLEERTDRYDPAEEA